MEMHPFFQVLDPYLIWFYRITGHTGVDFVIGTFVLACISMLIGEVTVSLAFRFTRKRLGEKTAEAEKYQNLSMDALKAGNKEAYQATNKLAKDAFGHTFFQQVALSSGFLWPVFFALAWMQYRFLEVEVPLPLLPFSLGFIGVFIIIYVATFFLFKQVKRRVSFSRLHQRNSVTMQPEPVK
jgi:hypothetical protein